MTRLLVFPVRLAGAFLAWIFAFAAVMAVEVALSRGHPPSAASWCRRSWQSRSEPW